jgi:vacuolar iron transporter family protein
VIAVVIGLALTGSISARLGGAPPLPAIIRNVAVGLVTMGVTYGVGVLFGVATGG